MPETAAIRQGAFDQLAARAAAVTFTPCPPAARFVFRGRPAGFAAAGDAFGVALPQTACRAATTGGRSALWLGPDEWLLLAEDGAVAAIEAAFADRLGQQPHSLVDVSHRNTAVEIAGPAAADVLNAGCPLDLRLEAFPVGMCTRTLFAKAEIVLWRTDAQRFRVEVWRSFAGYLWGLLDEIRREHAA
jgi:sarcosine oxidase subunit gamma